MPEMGVSTRSPFAEDHSAPDVDQTPTRIQLLIARGESSRRACTGSPSRVGLIAMSEARERTEISHSSDLPRTRTYTDDLGMTWHVTEQPFSEYDRRRGSSLIFASELAVRRVRNYPSDWFTLSEVALAALSWRA
jgi:hypothetical protein